MRREIQSSGSNCHSHVPPPPAVSTLKGRVYNGIPLLGEGDECAFSWEPGRQDFSGVFFLGLCRCQMQLWCELRARNDLSLPNIIHQSPDIHQPIMLSNESQLKSLRQYGNVLQSEWQSDIHVCFCTFQIITDEQTTAQMLELYGFFQTLKSWALII